MESLFTYLALALDTLPEAGRIMLLCGLLAVALYGLARVNGTGGLDLLYRKGALVALIAVPALVYVTHLQMPVHADDVVPLRTAIPTYVTYGFVVVWLLGAVWFAVGLYRTWKNTLTRIPTVENAAALADKAGMPARVEHWCRRLNLHTRVVLVPGGADSAWHTFTGLNKVVVVVPAASLNWPVGVVDVMLLQQLAQVKQRSWPWLLFARWVRVLYWPMPWVAEIVRQLEYLLVEPALSLAASAYRDPEGWRRDLRQYQQRSNTLAPVPNRVLHMTLPGAIEPETAAQSDDGDDPASFEQGWARTKLRLRDKYASPYEQAYWLIAVASVAVGMATTLTIVKKPPEFEPEFLQDKWRDGMVRRIREFDEPAPKNAVSNKEPPRTVVSGVEQEVGE